MAEDPQMEELRREIANKASTTIHLCSIDDHAAISLEWASFIPICELIRSSVDDEESIPAHLSLIDVKITELRRKLNASNLNEVIALNLLKLFYDFVKFLKVTPTASSTHSDTVAELEMMKSENFILRTQNENHKQALEKSRVSRETIREIMSTFEIEDDERKREKGIVSIVQGPPLDLSSFLCPPKQNKTMELRSSARAKRTPVMTRTTHSYETTLMNNVGDWSSMDDPPSTLSILPSSSPRPEEMGNTSVESTLERLLGSICNDNAKESKERKREMKEERTTRRRRAQSPVNGMEEEGMEKKRACVESNQLNGGDDGMLQCPFDGCERIFHKTSTLVDHTMSDHYFEGAIQLGCTQCINEFESEGSFEKHLMNCPYGEISASAKMWEQQETEAEQEERLRLEKTLLSCPYDDCDYVAKTRSRSIFKHMAKCHGNHGRAWYKCECGKRRRALHTILFHRYSECHNSGIAWMIDSPVALKQFRSSIVNTKEEDDDEEEVRSMEGTSFG